MATSNYSAHKGAMDHLRYVAGCVIFALVLAVSVPAAYALVPIGAGAILMASLPAHPVLAESPQPKASAHVLKCSRGMLVFTTTADGHMASRYYRGSQA
jgi:hypothetical protein